jgi:membrane fusion protein, multidrug efflux system
MKTPLALIIVLTLFLGTSPGAAAADTASVLVRTQPLARHELSETISCYGTVDVDPLSTESINVPRAGQVTRLLVSRGEAVKKGAPLLEFETNPRESVNYAQARTGVDLAKGELARVRDLLAQQLATRAQLAAAEKAQSDAEAELAAQEKLGTGLPSQMISAPFDGIVSALLVGQGERISAGATALRLSRQDRLRIVLGLEPEDARRIKRGMPVLLTPVFDRAQAAGAVSAVSDMIDPRTGLVELFVKLKPGQAVRLIPGTRMEGRVAVASRRGIAVPRQAVLSDDGGAYLFVVRNGRAHRIDVKTGIEANGFVGIAGRFERNDRVVVTGNYELEEGMAVREAPE